MENYKLQITNHKQVRISKIVILMLLWIWCFGFGASANAATAVVEVDTGTEDVNALEGTLVLPENMRVDKTQTGNSIILFWITMPEQVGNIITFAGITPGGFEDVYPIFTIHGDFNAKDLERVRFESVNALKNDGSGASVPVIMTLSPIELQGDTEPPEDFTPVIASDLNVFDGKYFLVFATQDKNSGINHYEVRESRWGWFTPLEIVLQSLLRLGYNINLIPARFIPAEKSLTGFREAGSPYLLEHQTLDRDVYVKAIDNAGNERVAVVPARVHSAWWDSYGLFAILIVIVLVALAYKKTWIRFTK